MTQQLVTLTVRPKNKHIFFQELIKLMMDSETQLDVSYNVEEADNVNESVSAYPLNIQRLIINLDSSLEDLDYDEF